MGATEFDLCWGQRSKQYIQVAPQWPPKFPSLGCCVCVSVSPHPGSSPGPGKSLGHTDTDLSSATLRLIPDFMGAGKGEGLGRCAQLGPPEFQPQLLGTSLFHWLRRRGLRRGRGAISSWHRDTKMSPVTVKYKDSAPDRWVPNGRGVTGRRGVPRCWSGDAGAGPL